MEQLMRMTTLPCGLRICSSHIAAHHSVSLGIWVDGGTIDEQVENQGVAHLLEHMMFKGTTTRTARMIACEVEDTGGSINAYTGRHTTAYYIRTLKENTQKSLDILFDILCNSTFPQEEMVKEQKVVLQEIGECEDNPDDIIFDYLQEACFPNQPAGRAILGTRDTVQAMTTDNLRHFIAQNYQSGRLIISAAGGVEHEELLEWVKQSYPVQEKSAPFTPQRPASHWGGGARLYKRELEQLHLVLAFPGVSMTSPDFYVSKVFSVLLGGGMSSRLFQEIREKRGLAYSIGSFDTHLEDNGIFGIYAGLSSPDAVEMLRVSIEQIAALADDITEDELQRARTQLLAGIVMSMEASFTHCEMMVTQQLLYNRFLSMEEIRDKIMAVGIEDLRRFSQKLLMTERPTLCTIGDVIDFNSWHGEMADFLQENCQVIESV